MLQGANIFRNLMGMRRSEDGMEEADSWKAKTADWVKKGNIAILEEATFDSMLAENGIDMSKRVIPQSVDLTK